MSIDPYTDMAQWLDMDVRTEAMLRDPLKSRMAHPAGKGLMSSEQQDTMEQRGRRS